jgi:erythromycin esterase-like protein
VREEAFEMKGERFIAEVKNLAELGSNEEARKATYATLETLKERLAGNEPSNLAAQLPPEVAPYVEGHRGREAFSVQEFYDRVAQKESVGHDEAVRHTRAVATVVQAAVTGGELEDVRDQHMAETLERLMHHHGPRARAIGWEHNTHVGDARFTDMADVGMVNVGQLARERWGGEDVVLVGFGSHRGSVIAGAEWGAPLQRMRVPPAREGSWEDVLHRAGEEDRLLVFAGLGEQDGFFEPREHRAIGVVYNSARERYGNYVPTVLPRRYDAFFYLDETSALHPLRVPPREDGEPPETFPSGE